MSKKQYYIDDANGFATLSPVWQGYIFAVLAGNASKIKSGQRIILKEYLKVVEQRLAIINDNVQKKLVVFPQGEEELCIRLYFGHWDYWNKLISKKRNIQSR